MRVLICKALHNGGACGSSRLCGHTVAKPERHGVMLQVKGGKGINPGSSAAGRGSAILP